jgi:predicted ATPase
MDVLAFLGTFVAENLDAAIAQRTTNFHDLVWGREGNRLRLAVEALVPAMELSRVGDEGWVPIEPPPQAAVRVTGGEVIEREGRVVIETLPRRKICYDVEVFADSQSHTITISEEALTVEMPGSAVPVRLARRGLKGAEFKAERGTAHASVAVMSQKYSVVANYPLDLADSPSVFWLRSLLAGDICCILLEPEKLRAPSPPFRGKPMILTGSHLAPFVAELQDKFPDQFEDWVKHLRTCVPGLESVRTVLRPEDRHRYLMVRYKNGIEAPSWVVSDGTLRLMALTVLAYLPTEGRIYVVEEPENGVHPTAIEAIYQSFTSVYDGQVLMASHSPILLNLARPEDLLCFSNTDEGTEIISGDQHPVLKEWKGEVALSDLFAGGVLS